MQWEYSEEEYYKSLPDDIYHYEKLIIAETYKNGYYFVTEHTPEVRDKNIYKVSSLEFDKVGMKSSVSKVYEALL